MSKMTLKDISKEMRDIDIAMLSTHAENGQIAGRPMSNNREVDYDGDNYYFAFDQTMMVADIARDPKVSLTFQGKTGLFGHDLFLASVEGQGELIRDKASFKTHWTSGLDHWFKSGVDTPGLILIKVHATRIHYWRGQDEGELLL
jgi:general stress protein 26